jgi:hypothetical protein
MKKLSLKTSDFQRGEVLTRKQLKNVLGGDGSGSGGDTPCTSECSDDTNCITPDDAHATCSTYVCDTAPTTTFKVCIPSAS